MTAPGGSSRPAGALSMRVFRADGRVEDVQPLRTKFDQITSDVTWPAHELSMREIAFYGLPQTGLDERVNRWRTRNFGNLLRGARRAALARKLGLSNVYGSLFLTKITADGEIIELGLASMRVVTTAGANFLVDAMQGTVEPEILRFHGVGTGTNAEATGDTALQAELTTQYNPDNTRATGTLAEGASGNIFRSVGTNTVDTAAAITEHGLFSQAATGGGTLLDRSVFAVVNLAPGDSLQNTYDFTIAAGS